MKNLIEQAAHRLQQLRQAGVQVPEGAAPAPAMRPPGGRSLPPTVQPTRAAPEDAGALSKRVELDLATIAAQGIVTPDAPRSYLADQYRVIKRPLIMNAKGRGTAALNHANLIMVTSAVAGEGKTFTAINLAMSIAAEVDNTVMLVDADVARPSILRMLQLPRGPGLLDLLEGKCGMAEALLRTSVDSLSILPSGTLGGRATELLASTAMRDLLNDMAERYADRIIIFDSPPLLLTTESRVLATQMGQIVVVVDAERTLQSDVQQALATIESCPVRLLLLNRARGDSSGGYGYGYGYGYGAETQPA